MKTEPVKIISNAHLGTRCTFGIDAVADMLIEYSHDEELPNIAWLLNNVYRHMPILHLGAGSNLLPAHDFHGVVLKSRISGISVDGEYVTAGAGVTFDDLICYCLKEQLYGIENLSGIPGEVGAAAVQNIGAYGAEVKDVIECVEGFNLRNYHSVAYSRSDCSYAYRDSIFKHELRECVAITRVTFRLKRTFTPNLSYAALAHAVEGKTITPQLIRDTVIRMRNRKLPDPKVLGNAGSFFINPIISKDEYNRLQSTYPNPDIPCYTANDGMVKIPAAWLIEQCGWKGRNMGQAACYQHQPLVLVNLGGATGKDIIDLKDHIVADVQKRFGITIRPEVNIL